jgi:hypothetical protein
LEQKQYRIQRWYHAITDCPIVRHFSSQCAECVGIGRIKAVKSRRKPCRLKSRLFVAVAAVVDRGPISKWKTDRLGMGERRKPRLSCRNRSRIFRIIAAAKKGERDPARPNADIWAPNEPISNPWQ